MSTLAPTDLTSAGRSPSELPGALAASRVELAKLSEQLTVRLLLAVCLLAPLGFATVMTIQSSVPADTLFGRWATTTGFAAALTVLGFAGSWGLPLLAGVVAGDVFSSEDRLGTWKTLLTRSCSRTDVFVGKVLAAFAATLLAVVVLALSSLVFCVALVGSSPLVGLSGQLVEPGRAWELVLASWATALLPTLAFAALAMLLSVVTRSGIVGVLGPAVVGLVMQLLSLLASGEVVRAVLLATPFDAWHGLFTVPAHHGPLAQGAVTSLVYIVLFTGATWLVVRRRAFAGSWAVQEKRWRTPLRTAVVAAAIVAVLAVASGWGPTTVTAARLQSSITPTFERLVLLQYRWRTHSSPANASVDARATCRRGGSTRAASGPGDDWACVVRVLRPQATGSSLTLEVTVRANGCYTAQAPPSLVGALVLPDLRGGTFVNPLYAFDGCFGTA